ncbi:MAG: energy transducer TonB [Gammaproteobacteria bacterium]|nr:energy transducer TonB [Gammaproteobacteria bacterium]
MRYGISLVLGVIMAIALFALMDRLVSGSGTGNFDKESTQFVDFIRVKRDEQTRTKDRQIPEKPEPPKKPPPPQIATTSADTRPQTPELNMNLPQIGTSVGAGGPFMGNPFQGMATGDGDVIPIVQVQPRYPREALRNCITGSVKLEFTILEDGSVEDPRVIEADPPRLFNREAERAILRWKFKPRIIDGRPVSRPASLTMGFEPPQGC